MTVTTATHKPNKRRFQTRYAILLIIIAISAAFHIATRYSVTLSNTFNFGISNHIRGILAAITSVLPFSLGETIIIIVPFFMLVLIITTLFSNLSDKTFNKITFRLSVLTTALYSLFAFSFAPAYGTSTADVLFDIDAKPLTAEDLKLSASILSERINQLSNSIEYNYGSFSKMNYDIDELSEKLLKAYDLLESKYPFINNFKSRLKPIALSEPMTYTHISGVYSYYTGESNINTNFPDYTIPFTSAHEMAHQRGFARENEANFVAFLVCCESNDPYIRYSGYLNMYEYVTNALYLASREDYYSSFYSLDIKVRCEMAKYSEFFEQYKDSTASKVSGTLNDNYLKSQGIVEGEKSYGLVVDLAVNYINKNFAEEAIE